MKRNTIRLTESQLHKVIKETVRQILKEEQYMSDEDIANQYSDFNVTHLSVERRHDYWVGTVELEFPNADDIDFDSIVVDNFISYDINGNKIAFDRWYPDEVYYNLCQMIRKEIKKQS